MLLYMYIYESSYCTTLINLKIKITMIKKEFGRIVSRQKVHISAGKLGLENRDEDKFGCHEHKTDHF